VILLNQAGKNTHQDICDSLTLFAREVMPEFHVREAEHQAWKQAVLNSEIELEEIDTEPYNFRARGAPTLPSSTVEKRDMIAGTTGRPGSSRPS
jgi:hypothetical protein